MSLTQPLTFKKLLGFLAGSVIFLFVFLVTFLVFLVFLIGEKYENEKASVSGFEKYLLIPNSKILLTLQTFLIFSFVKCNLPDGKSRSLALNFIQTLSLNFLNLKLLIAAFLWIKYFVKGRG